MRTAIIAAGERGQNWGGEEQKGDGGRNGISRQPQAALRAVLVLVEGSGTAQLSKDQRLAGLDAHAGEVKAGTGVGEGGFDEVKFAC